MLAPGALDLLFEIPPSGLFDCIMASNNPNVEICSEQVGLVVFGGAQSAGTQA